MIKVINDYYLKKKDIDEYGKKARLIIENDNDEVLVANYGGVYLLPGGTSENGEYALETLYREIEEELGIKLDMRIVEPLKEIHHYQKDYPKRDGNTVNRKISTFYFYTKMNINLDEIKNNLTNEERKDNFNLRWVSKNELGAMLKENEKTSDNPRVSYFTNELLEVINLLDEAKAEDPMYGKHKSGDDLVVLMLHEDRIKKERFQKDSYIDMHTHTIFSDGIDTPDELIKKAYDKHIGTIAITDHDTLEGVKNIDYYTGQTMCMNIIPGIELTAKVDKGTMHILGYDIDVNDADLNNMIAKLRTNSYYSIIALINQLKIDYGITFSSDEIKELFNKPGNIGRPHLAKLLVKNGYVSASQEAFDKYLIEAYKKTKPSNKGIDYKECISLIKEAGGLAVLAHPNQLKMSDDELDNTIATMKKHGLDGIEVYHSCHSKEEVKKYADLAGKYDLLVSGGSDYHGKEVKPNVKLGETSSGKIKRLSIIDYLRKKGAY